MKIEYVKGNLFTTNILHIVHGCNAQGNMGSGVAKIIRDDYPEAHKEYVARHKISPWRLGEIQAVPSNGKIIINAITQNRYGGPERHANYEAIAKVMEKINDMFYDISDKNIAMPKIGAGLANGDWNVIEAIIESELTNVQPYVYII